MSAPTPTPTPVGIANAQNDVVSGFADSSGITGIMGLLVVAIAIVVAVQFISPWLARSRILNRLGSTFADSLVYAIKGVAALAAAGIFAVPVWLVVTAEPGTRSMLGRYAAYAIGGYLTLVIVGWLADRAVSRFIDAHPDYDSWSDLWPDTPDEGELKEANV